MSVSNQKLIGQPGPRQTWQHQAINNWIRSNAWSWLDSATTLRNSTDGGTVQVMPDNSDHANRWVQNTAANRPLVALGAINGLAALEYDAGTQKFNTMSAAGLEMNSESGVLDRHVFLVVQFKGANIDHAIFRDTISNVQDMFVNDNNGLVVDAQRIRATGQTSPTWKPINGATLNYGVPYLLEVSSTGVGVGNERLRGFTNGVLHYDQLGEARAWSTSDGSAVHLGFDEVGGYLDGYIGEAIIFNFSLYDPAFATAQARTDVRKYLSDKWKLGFF